MTVSPSNYNNQPETGADDSEQDFEEKIAELERDLETIETNASKSEQVSEQKTDRKEQETIQQNREEDMEHLRNQISAHYKHKPQKEKPEDNLTYPPEQKNESEVPKMQKIKVTRIVSVAKEDGVYKAVEKIKKTGDPFLVDEFHKKITGEHRTEL